MGMVQHLAKLDFQREVPAPNFAQGKNPAQHNLMGKNCITPFLNRHPLLAVQFASRIDHQPAYASNSHIIQSQFQKLGKIMRAQRFSDKAITNVNEIEFVMGITLHTEVVIRWGKKIPWIEQDGKQEFITALEAEHQQQLLFPSESPGCAGQLWWLWGTSYPLMENYTLPVAQATGIVA